MMMMMMGAMQVPLQLIGNCMYASGLSLITNLCVMVPGGGPPPNHEEVLDATRCRAAQMEQLVQVR